MSESRPFVFDGSGEAKRHAPATERNRDAIAAELAQVLPTSGLVIEVASGTGEHVLHFAKLFPTIDWQPSDPEPAALASISAWSREAGLSNIHAPLRLDAAASTWPVACADAILCINMVHISPWAATLGLLDGAARLLPPGGVLFLYGPYRQSGVQTAPSNEAFDVALKERNAEWGLRLLEEVVEEAKTRGLVLDRVVPMPANNLSVVFLA